MSSGYVICMGDIVKTEIHYVLFQIMVMKVNKEMFKETKIFITMRTFYKTWLARTRTQR